jgi:hypothetical protein
LCHKDQQRNRAGDSSALKILFNISTQTEQVVCQLSFFFGKTCTWFLHHVKALLDGRWSMEIWVRESSPWDPLLALPTKARIL